MKGPFYFFAACKFFKPLFLFGGRNKRETQENRELLA
jgi:hypothetical protein